MQSAPAATDIRLASKLFRQLGDFTRLSILVQLADGERRVTDLVERLQGSQGNISGHLSCLKECGLVLDRRDGRQVFYRVAHPEVAAVLQAAENLLALTGTGVDLCANRVMGNAR